MVPRVWLVLACGFGLTGSAALAVVESTPKNQKKKTSATTKAGPKKKGSAPTAASRKGAGASSKKSPASKKSATVSSSSRKKAVRPAGKRPVHAVRRSPVQRQPAPERYKEIQQALASRGYFQNTPDGAWGQSSVDALKRFQQDQNLEPTGKLNSLSLIALGLGPKHEAPLAAPPSTQPSRP